MGVHPHSHHAHGARDHGQRRLLLAVERVGSSGDYLAVKRALEKGMTIAAAAAADLAVPLKRLITPAQDTPPS